MLIQKRNSNLERYPNYWDISGSGHVNSGETTDEAIERKIFEMLWRMVLWRHIRIYQNHCL